MDDLTKLAAQYGSDKGTSNPTHHGYTVHYNQWFGAFRNEVRAVLEFGVHNGASLRMWRDYFPQAMVYGVDYAQEVSEQSLIALRDDCTRVLIGNQTDPAIWAALVDSEPYGFDLIVDDASHNPQDYIATFNAMWPHTRRWYVIEDVKIDDVSQLFASWESKGDFAVIQSTHAERRAILVAR